MEAELLEEKAAASGELIQAARRFVDYMLRDDNSVGAREGAAETITESVFEYWNALTGDGFPDGIAGEQSEHFRQRDIAFADLDDEISSAIERLHCSLRGLYADGHSEDQIKAYLDGAGEATTLVLSTILEKGVKR
jgi:hypothetical protein